MARRPAARQAVGRRRQRVEWTAGDMESTVSLASNQLASLGSSTIMLEAIDAMTSPTLIRVRGELVTFMVTGSAGHQCIFGVGMAVVNRRASAVGTTALPRLVSDPDYSWLYHAYVFHDQGNGAIVRSVVDSKAMRKILSKEEEIVFCFENDTGGTITVAVAISVRVLLKEA